MIDKLNLLKKLSFSVPKKNEIGVYDLLPEKNILLHLLSKRKFSQIFVRNEILYIKLIIKVFFSIKSIDLMLRYNFYVAYLFQVIKEVNPKILITFIDNNIYFYILKNYFKKIKFISIQNGKRSEFPDFFGDAKIKNNKSKFLKSDFFFVFSESIGKKFNKYIKSKYCAIGSYKSNFYKIKSHNKIKKSVLWISQYRDENIFQKIIFNNLETINKNNFY